jgi:hypothetical protein
MVRACCAGRGAALNPRSVEELGAPRGQESCSWRTRPGRLAHSTCTCTRRTRRTRRTHRTRRHPHPVTCCPLHTHLQEPRCRGRTIWRVDGGAGEGGPEARRPRLRLVVPKPVASATPLDELLPCLVDVGQGVHPPVVWICRPRALIVLRCPFRTASETEVLLTLLAIHAISRSQTARPRPPPRPWSSTPRRERSA